MHFACLLSLGDDLLPDLARPGFEVGAQLVYLRSLGSNPDLPFVTGIRRGLIATARAMHKRNLKFFFAADGCGRRSIPLRSEPSGVIRDVASRAMRSGAWDMEGCPAIGINGD